MPLLTQWTEPEPFEADEGFDYNTFNQVQENFLYLKQRPISVVKSLGSGLSNLTVTITPQTEPTGFFKLTINTLTGNVLLFGTLRIVGVNNGHFYVRWKLDDDSYVGNRVGGIDNSIMLRYYMRETTATHTISFSLPVFGLPIGVHTFEPEFYTSAVTGTFYVDDKATNIAVMEL